jgi:hypothetical protein
MLKNNADATLIENLFCAMFTQLDLIVNCTMSVVDDCLEYCKNNSALYFTKFLKCQFNKNLKPFGCEGYDDRMFKNIGKMPPLLKINFSTCFLDLTW